MQAKYNWQEPWHAKLRESKPQKVDLAKITQEESDLKAIEKKCRPEVISEQYGSMKTFKTKKGELGEIFIMQDLSPRQEQEGIKFHKRVCGVSKNSEVEDFKLRKKLKAQWNNISSRPATQGGAKKGSLAPSRNVLSQQNFKTL